jgi:hypothetical protein
MIETISAITLATNDIAGAVRFCEAVEFEIIHGDKDALFTSFRAVILSKTGGAAIAKL